VEYALKPVRLTVKLFFRRQKQTSLTIIIKSAYDVIVARKCVLIKQLK